MLLLQFALLAVSFLANLLPLLRAARLFKIEIVSALTLHLLEKVGSCILHILYQAML